MKPYNEQEFNRLCAEFIGLECHEPSGYWTLPTFMDGDGWTMTDMKFHSDWNWIMEVVEKIEKLDRVDKRVYFKISGGEVFLTVLEDFQEATYQFLYQENGYISDSKKEAVIQAIWQFLNWYNEQKQ